MTTKTFPSKVDAWIAMVLVATIVVVVAAFAATAIEGTEPEATAVIGLIAFVTVLLILSVLLRTQYRVDKDTLTIVSGPFRWKIPRADIAALENSRTALSSPALSMDRLRIRYGNNKSIVVSPADKQRFARALGMNVDG